MTNIFNYSTKLIKFNQTVFKEITSTKSSLPYYYNNDKELISFYLMGVTIMIICCLGIIGNILSLIVLSRRSIGSSTTNTYLISLAIADILVLLATILTAIKDSRKPIPGKLIWIIWQDAPIVPKMYPYCHATAILFQVFLLFVV